MRKLIGSLFVLSLVLISVHPVQAADPAAYDTGFAFPNGYTTAGFSDGQWATDTTVGDDGSVYVALMTESSGSATGYRPAVMKFTDTGVLDTTFGTNGFFEIPVDLAQSYLDSTIDIALSVDPTASDKMIYVSFPGNGGTPSSRNFFLVRIKSDGSGLDGDFGLLGVTTAAFDHVGGDDPGDDVPYDMTVTIGDTIIVVGGVESIAHDEDFGIAAFLDDGSLYADFGSPHAGRLTLSFDEGGYNSDRALGVTNNYDFVAVVGSVETASGTDAAVTILTHQGVLLQSFGTDGSQLYHYIDLSSGLSSSTNFGSSVVLVPDPSKNPTDTFSDFVYVGGQSSDPSILQGTLDMAVFCTTASGALCPSFGIDGWTLFDFSDGSLFGIGDTDDMARNIGWYEADNQITLIGGAKQLTGNQEEYLALARLDAGGGSPDSSFGYNGHHYYTEVSDANLNVSGFLDTHNQIVVATFDDVTSNEEDVWVARMSVEEEIFSDGFENGNNYDWSSTYP